VKLLESKQFIKTSSFDLVLDPHFKPAITALEHFENAVKNSKNYHEVQVAIKRHHEQMTVYQTVVFHESHVDAKKNVYFLERLIKTLLWTVGGYEVLYKGPLSIGTILENIYSHQGERKFDVGFMERIYEHEFRFIIVSSDETLKTYEMTQAIGRNLDGCRIGFDAGGSDRKVSAVVNGEAIYSEEVIWYPKINNDPNYHIQGIKDSILRAASKMPRVDAIGVSSAGVYIDNKAMVASLFREVPDHLYNEFIKPIYIKIAKELDVDIEVANDGDVTALAGSMSLNDYEVLGIAMGTSQAVGYVNHEGHITGWLNELAFVPVDFSGEAPQDEWSKDYGVGVSYFSQEAVIRLAPAANIMIDDKLTPAEKLDYVQKLVQLGHEGALEIFRTIGIYLGYALAYYARFYQFRHVLILGRVTSNLSGELIIKWAKEVLKKEFKSLYDTINIQLPDEKSRRVGQSIAAASLPKIKEKK